MRQFLERLRTAWNTITDNPSARTELSFGEMPPSLMVKLEAIAEHTGQPISHVCYDALCEGADVLHALLGADK